jgi:hypothetical protein
LLEQARGCGLANIERCLNLSRRGGTLRLQKLDQGWGRMPCDLKLK